MTLDAGWLSFTMLHVLCTYAKQNRKCENYRLHARRVVLEKIED